MSNIEKARKMREEFDEQDVFGGKITFRQLWWIIKLVKIVRKFARSNTALYNLLNEMFRGIATFKEVKKASDRKFTNGLSYMIPEPLGTQSDTPTFYLGLEIVMKVGTEEVTEVKEGDEEQ